LAFVPLELANKAVITPSLNDKYEKANYEKITKYYFIIVICTNYSDLLTNYNIAFT